MIKNDRQYQITKSRLSDFKESLSALEKKEMDPLLKELHTGALKSQIVEFEKQIIEYELLKEGVTNFISLDNISNIYEVLIKARIAKGWTQADLAKKLNLKEQQIQRYEISNYSAASMERIIEVANSLDISVEKFKLRIIKPKFELPQEVQEKVSEYRMKRRHLLVA